MAWRPRNRILSFATSLAILLAAAAGSPATQGAVARGGDACGTWSDLGPDLITAGQARKATLCLINAERARFNLPALTRNRKLERAAQNHTQAMLGTGCFSHQCPAEPELEERLEASRYLVGGLKEWRFAENIAWGLGGDGTPRSVVDNWIKSYGHHANILSRKLREIGIGFAPGSPDSAQDFGAVYTTDFGFRIP